MELKLLTVDEATKLIPLSRDMLWRAIRRGTIPSQAVVRLGRRVFLRESALLAWMDDQAAADRQVS